MKSVPERDETKCLTGGILMAFVPFEKLVYETNLARYEVINRINNIVQPRDIFHMFKKDRYGYGKPYQGEVHGNEFNITRVIRYQNSFLPIIKGTIIETGNNQTKIIVKMRMHGFVIVFMSIFLGVATIMSVITLPLILITRELDFTFLGSFLTVLFGYLLMTCAFKYESNKSKIYFDELFK